MDSTQRCLALVAVVLWAFGGGVGRAATQPNILRIVADDVGAEASGLYQLTGGSGTAPMPNIDALAARGLVFENSADARLTECAESHTTHARFTSVVRRSTTTYRRRDVQEHESVRRAR